MANMKKCPNCGSERITINGVQQRKKGLGYYLSGAFAQEAGQKTGFKAFAAVKGLNTNAECLNCKHKWLEK